MRSTVEEICGARGGEAAWGADSGPAAGVPADEAGIVAIVEAEGGRILNGAVGAQRPPASASTHPPWSWSR